MMHMQHTISLHNLLVAANICWKAALTIRFPDDKKSLPGSIASLEEITEPGYRCETVFYSNVL